MRLASLAFSSALIFLPIVSSAAPEFSALAAHYVETRQLADAPPESHDWYFTRRANEVETARGDYSELWQRDERGELTLTRIYHQEKKRIQYTPGELRTQHRQKEWPALNSIVDATQLATLARVGTLSFLGRPAQRYAGTMGRETIEVVWLTHEALAAQYTRTTRDGQVKLELKEVRATPDADWPQANLAVTDRYDFIDGADLGDMEYDPFVERVLASDAHHVH